MANGQQFGQNPARINVGNFPRTTGALQDPQTVALLQTLMRILQSRQQTQGQIPPTRASASALLGENFPMSDPSFFRPSFGPFGQNNAMVTNRVPAPSTSARNIATGGAFLTNVLRAMGKIP